METDPFAHSLAVSKSEFSEIVNALLEQHEFEGLPMAPPMPGDAPRAHVRHPVMLVTTTLKFCKFKAETQDNQCDGENIEYLSFVAATSQIALAERKQLLDVNSESAVFPCRDGKWHKCIEKSEIAGIFSREGWWPDFYAKYPETAGYVSISVPVFIEQGKRAITFVAHHCDGLCGTGTLFMLEKAEKGWVLTHVEQVWIS